MKPLLSLFASFVLCVSVAWAQEIEILNGLVTTPNVDITADDGSLLSERLQVGDKVYIIKNPNDRREGWVRISKSPEDLDGIGWVEAKNVRSFSRYKIVKDSPGRKGQVAKKRSPSRARSNAGTQAVAIAPFVYSSASQSFGKSTEKIFLRSVKKNGSFQVRKAPSRVDPESKASLQLIGTKMKLDGVFTGKVSDPIGGGRLLQVKFYSVGKDDFVAEKTKRISSGQNPEPVIRDLVQEILNAL